MLRYRSYGDDIPGYEMIKQKLLWEHYQAYQRQFKDPIFGLWAGYYLLWLTEIYFDSVIPENPEARDLGQCLQPAGTSRGAQFIMLDLHNVAHHSNYDHLLVHSSQVKDMNKIIIRSRREILWSRLALPWSNEPHGKHSQEQWSLKASTSMIIATTVYGTILVPGQLN